MNCSSFPLNYYCWIIPNGLGCNLANLVHWFHQTTGCENQSSCGTNAIYDVRVHCYALGGHALRCVTGHITNSLSSVGSAGGGAICSSLGDHGGRAEYCGFCRPGCAGRRRAIAMPANAARRRSAR
ncbi:hypothetical protein D3C80_1304330 [compost metagenome]